MLFLACHSPRIPSPLPVAYSCHAHAHATPAKPCAVPVCCCPPPSRSFPSQLFFFDLLAVSLFCSLACCSPGPHTASFALAASFFFFPTLTFATQFPTPRPLCASLPSYFSTRVWACTFTHASIPNHRRLLPVTPLTLLLCVAFEPSAASFDPIP